MKMTIMTIFWAHLKTMNLKQAPPITDLTTATLPLTLSLLQLKRKSVIKIYRAVKLEHS